MLAVLAASLLGRETPKVSLAVVSGLDGEILGVDEKIFFVMGDLDLLEALFMTS